MTGRNVNKDTNPLKENKDGENITCESSKITKDKVGRGLKERSKRKSRGRRGGERGGGRRGEVSRGHCSLESPWKGIYFRTSLPALPNPQEIQLSGAGWVVTAMKWNPGHFPFFTWISSEHPQALILLPQSPLWVFSSNHIEPLGASPLSVLQDSHTHIQRSQSQGPHPYTWPHHLTLPMCKGTQSFQDRSSHFFSGSGQWKKFKRLTIVSIKQK